MKNGTQAIKAITDTPASSNRDHEHACLGTYELTQGGTRANLQDDHGTINAETVRRTRVIVLTAASGMDGTLVNQRLVDSTHLTALRIFEDHVSDLAQLEGYMPFGDEMIIGLIFPHFKCCLQIYVSLTPVYNIYLCSGRGWRGSLALNYCRI